MMKLNQGGKMLDYLKKVNSIILILLLTVSVAYSYAIPSKPKDNQRLLDAEYVKAEQAIFEVNDYVGSIPWCYTQPPDCDNRVQVDNIARILEKWGWQENEYYITAQTGKVGDIKVVFLNVVFGSKIDQEVEYRGNWTILNPNDVEKNDIRNL